MKLIILGSSSKGNSYALQASTGEVLLIEAGLPFLDVLRATGYDRSKIVGCCVSHRHTDHAKYVSEYITNGIQVFSNEEVKGATPLEPSHWICIGFDNFAIMPFFVTHDVTNFGYLIHHPEIGTLLFATDCMDIPTIFKGINHFLIEANYSDSKLLLSDTDKAQKRRIMESHQSFESCLQYLMHCHAENAKTITLIHLSSRHSDPEYFRLDIEKTFGVPCNIARKNTTIELCSLQFNSTSPTSEN